MNIKLIENVQEIINIIKKIISRNRTDIARPAGVPVDAQVRRNPLSTYIIDTLEIVFLLS